MKRTVKCLLCDMQLGAISSTHLWKKHRCTTSKYLLLFPDAMLYPGRKAEEGKDFVKCLICKTKHKTINAIHLKKHGVSVKEYVTSFPEAQLACEDTCQRRKNALLGREIPWKDKISKSVAKSWGENRFQGRTGIPLSQESKDKLSKKMKGHEVSEETRKKIGIAGLGREPWNKNLTKENDHRLVTVSEKVAEWNKTSMTDEKKEQISQSLKKRYANGMKVPQSKTGFRKDLGQSFRSTWEANLARVLILYGKSYEYEPKTFCLMATDNKIKMNYLPDFWIEDGAYFLEVKGHASSESAWSCTCKRCLRDKRKMALMQEQYPNIKVRILGKKEYGKMSLLYKKQVNAHPNFQWENSSYD